jgi:ABC-type Zn uptake system ZnuABC Zn-binding protein ZnuA
LALLIVAALSTLPGCTKVPDPWPEKPGPKVLAAFAPIQCFALNVAGDDASLLCAKSNSGAHDSEVLAHQKVAVARADLFLINGLGLDDTFASKLSRSARNRSMRIIKLGDSIPADQLREGGCDCDDPSHHHDHGHYDPHVWLGIPQAIKMVERIRDVLKEADAPHSAGYDSRAAAYIAKLEQLQKDGKAAFAEKKNRKLLTFHDSLRYFAKSFDVEIADSIQIAPGVEVNPQRTAKLIELCKEKDVRVIAIEPQFDASNSAGPIARALKGQVELVTVDPLETAKPDEMNADWYERKMRENFRVLAEKLP